MCLGIFVYIYAGFTCIYLRMCTEFTSVGICLHICTQGLYVSVYILSIYTPSVHVRMNMTANIHKDLPYVCVYFGVYSHGVHLCVCTCFRVCTQRYIQNWYVYVYMVTYIHRGSTRGCVSGYVFTYIHTEFTSVCVYIHVYMYVCTIAYIYTDFTCVCV